MEKLVVKLPFKRRLRSNTASKNVDKSEEKKISERKRIQEYRLQLKNNPSLCAKAEKLKAKKKEENKSYTEKVHQRRKNDPAYDEKIRQRDRERKRLYRKRKADNLKRKSQKLAQTVKKPCKLNEGGSKKADTHSLTRKRAQRLRQSLPEDSEGWAKTVNHLLQTATPRRKSLINLNEDQTVLKNLIKTQKQGRPLKSVHTIKRKLAFSQISDNLWAGKSLGQYQRRKKVQVKRLSKAVLYKEKWQGKVTSFLDDHSRVMPNKKDTILVNGESVAKRHLLMSKNELYKMFKNQNPTFTRKFSTFLKYIPKQYKNLDMRCRRVCVCTKCYNMEKKVEAMNAITRKYDKPELKITLRELSEKTLCEFEHRPHRICVDRVCGSCGTDRVNLFYQPVLEKIDQEEKVLFYQWEQVSEKYISREGKEIKTKRWVQAEKRLKPCDLVDMISEEMELFTGHLFRADYQHMVENQLMSNLPLDQAVVVMDFSENISLTPQDEIESAHWTIKQVTLHPIFIVRHAPESTIEKPVIQKESLIIVSDCLAHNAESVFVFTKKLIAHLQNNPGPCEIKTIHRFSDNCSVQYKCKYAFSHLIQLEEEHNLKLVYHFTESGHGKGPSDGLGAAVKMRLQRLILGEQRVVNNAYQVYLALTQTQVSSTQRACQNIIYVPQRVINQGKPQKVSVKTIKGTQSYHMVHSCEKGVLKCNDLSCGCQVCICDQEGPCFYSQYRHDAVFHPMLVERRSAERYISTYDDSSDQVCCEVIQNSCSDFIEQQQQTETALQEFTEHISKQGWKIRGVTPMDGNCFFWAVSDQLIRLHLDFQSHEELRNAVVDFISSFPKEKRNEMTEFLTTPFSTYIQSMQKNSTYADHIAIQAMSSVLGAHINIVHANKNSNVVLHPAESDSRTVLVVGYLENLQHYVSLDRIGPEDFVIVELTAGKRKQKYVAKVLETDTDDIKVRFMKKTATKGVFTWHEKDQIYWQSMSEIVRILKQPDLVPGRGIKLKFSEDLVF